MNQTLSFVRRFSEHCSLARRRFRLACFPLRGEFVETSLSCEEEVPFGVFSLASQCVPLSFQRVLASFGIPFSAKRNGGAVVVNFGG